MIALRSTIIRFYNNSINCSLTAVIDSVRGCSGAPEFIEECSTHHHQGYATLKQACSRAGGLNL